MLPKHMLFSLILNNALGVILDITEAVSELEQPFASVPVTIKSFVNAFVVFKTMLSLFKLPISGSLFQM